MLTKKQLDLLEFIHARVQRDGVPPSFDEMKEALDLRSKSGIHRLITALEERGFIRRLAHRARALEIVKLPDAMTGAKPGFTPRVIEGDRPQSTPRQAVPVETAGAVELPVMMPSRLALKPSKKCSQSRIASRPCWRAYLIESATPSRFSSSVQHSATCT